MDSTLPTVLAETNVSPLKRRFSDALVEITDGAPPALAALNGTLPHQAGEQNAPNFPSRSANPLQYAERAVMSEKSRIPCIHFKRPRGCNKGDACEYKHEGARDNRDYNRNRFT